MKGKFIVVEGLDGAGKSTAISFIKDFLIRKISKLSILVSLVVQKYLKASEI